MKDLEINLKSKNKDFKVSTSLCDVMYVVCPLFGHINCVYDNGTLSITSNKKIKSSGILKIYSFNLFSNKIKLYLPNNIRVGVTASLTFGNVCLNNLVINSANINNLYGNVVVKECNVDKLEVSSNTSKIKLFDVSGSNIDLYSENGDIGIINILSERLNAITNKGNISIKLYKQDEKLVGSREKNKPKSLNLSAPNGKISKCFYY